VAALTKKGEQAVKYSCLLVHVMEKAYFCTFIGGRATACMEPWQASHVYLFKARGMKPETTKQEK
jgi:hypothetical protein